MRNIMPVLSPAMRVTSRFGMRTLTLQGVTRTSMHNGIDLVGNPNNRNEPIVCVADGVVTGVRKTGVQWGAMCFVRVRHDNGWNTAYMHQQTNTITQNVGDRVKAGEHLGIIGTTGQSTGVHLHFQIDRGGNATAIDPWDFLFNEAPLFDPATNITTPTAPPQTGGTVTYVVRAGDTLGRIAAANNTTVEELARLNNIPNVNLIRIGQVLKMPGTATQVIIPPVASTPDIDVIANEVIRGDWGNGAERRARLAAAGHDPSVIQARVNVLLR